MKQGLKEIDPEAVEAAHDAARRSGVPVDQWLNSLTIDAAASSSAHDGGAAPDASAAPPPRPDDEPISAAAPFDRAAAPDQDKFLETLDRQIDDLAPGAETLSQPSSQQGAGTKSQKTEGGHGELIDSPSPGIASNGSESEQSDCAGTGQLTGAHLAQTIARIDRQLEAMRRSPRPGTPVPMHYGVDEAFAEITARQKALEFGFAPDFSDMGRQSSSHIDAATIDHRLRDLGEQIKALQPGCRYDGVGGEIGRDADNAASRQTFESIEEQLRHLTSQMGKAPAPVAVDQLVESLRSDLGEMGRRIEEALPHRTATVLQDQISALTAEIAKLNPRAEEVADVLRSDFAEFRAALKEAVPQHDAASLEDQLRTIVQEVAGLRPPLRAEAITEALRRDLAEFGEALKSAVPQDAGNSLQEQFESLNSRIADLHTPASVEDIAGVLRRDLTQLGEAVRSALPTDAITTLEREVRALGERIEANRGAGPSSPAFAELESNLAEVRDRLRALTPSEDMANLTESIRLLTRKADAIAVENSAPEILHQLEQGIVTLHTLASQVARPEAFDNLSRDIQALSDKIGRSGQYRSDPDAMTALEKRLDELAEAVGRRHGESLAIPAAPAEFDRLIETLVERLKSAQLPAADLSAATNLEHHVVSLIEKLDASEARIGRIDGVERGIDGLLAELKELRAQNERKLAAIQQQLTGAAERGGGPDESVKRDLAMLKEIQSAADRRTQDTFESVYGTVEQVVDRLAIIEQGLRDKETAKEAAILASRQAFVADGPSIAPAATAAAMADRVIAGVEGGADEPFSSEPQRPVSGAAAKAATPAIAGGGVAPVVSVSVARQPIDLPPDAPLEPGSGRRVRVVANAIDRIAASEAAIVGAGGKVVPGSGEAAPAGANFIAAARRAAQTATSEQAPLLAADERPLEVARPSLGRRLLRGVSFIALGIGLTILAAAGLGLAVDLLHNRSRNAAEPSSPAIDEPAAPAAQSARDPSVQDPFGQTPSVQGPSVQLPPVPERSGQEPSLPPLSSPPTSLPADTSPSGNGAALEAPEPQEAAGFLTEAASVAPTVIVAPPGLTSMVAPPTPSATSTPPAAPAEVTAMPGAKPAPARSSQNRDAAATATIASSPMPRDSAPDSVAVPAAIGGKTLRDAAAAGEPAASYEVAIRFAEGRNVPQDLTQAAAWFDRAARRGLAPAQFRLGSMYEKGLGLTKDLQEARRLYLAAADKGNAKAMHNLAVLYAEGLEGKPDYAVASQWFRKAAMFGIVDSQYNLAILQARGIGVDQNLAESYKWLALAARGGDKDAAKKRDEVATHLDAQQLESAKLAVEAFMPEHQPDEAFDVKAPAGGWDPVAVAAPGKKTPR